MLDAIIHIFGRRVVPKLSNETHPTRSGLCLFGEGK